MDHAGTPLHREDECHDRRCDWHGKRLGAPKASAARVCPTAIDGSWRDPKDSVRDLPVQAARSDASEPRDCLPFVLQAGRTLFIVAEDVSGWVVAELLFDPHSCVFTEHSCVWYDWPREAFGRLLSRVYSAEGDQAVEFSRVEQDFQQWLALQFAA